MARRSPTTDKAPVTPASAPALPEAPADVIARLDPVVLRVFAEQDFHRVDMRSIAREAGMSFRTIYRYFQDKEAMLFWFIAYWLRGLYPGVIQALQTGESPSTRMKNALYAHLQFYEKHPDVGRVIFMTVPLQQWMRHETYRADASVKQLLKVIGEGQACGEIRKDFTPIQVFDAWSGVFNRAFLMWEYRGRVYSLTGQWRMLCDMFLHGVADAADATIPRTAV